MTGISVHIFLSLPSMNHSRAATPPLEIPVPHREDMRNSGGCKFAEGLQRLVARVQNLPM